MTVIIIFMANRQRFLTLKKYKKILNPEFYLQGHVVNIAQSLLGKTLHTFIDQKHTAGMIVETEAYRGINDAACHANNGKCTTRNKIMYGAGGFAYVYICYGIHSLFNVVTNQKGHADAVLIRAVEPTIGIEIMQKRRGEKIKLQQLTSGPGKLTRALGINKVHNSVSLLGHEIWIEEAETIPYHQIVSDVRIGVDYAGNDALKPWRFFIKNNINVSKAVQKNTSV